MTHASLYCSLTLILRPTGTVSTFLMVGLMIDRMLLLLGVPFNDAASQHHSGLL